MGFEFNLGSMVVNQPTLHSGGISRGRAVALVTGEPFLSFCSLGFLGFFVTTILTR